MLFHIWFFIQSNTARSQSRTLAQVISTFLTPQTPTEEECTHDFVVYSRILTLQYKNFENYKNFQKTIHCYQNPIKNKIRLRRLLWKTKKKFLINIKNWTCIIIFLHQLLIFDFHVFFILFQYISFKKTGLDGT